MGDHSPTGPDRSPAGPVAEGATGPESEPERLDVITPTGTVIGALPRDEIHRHGLWHPVFHCLIVRSGQPARVVLQRRASTKATFPGKLDLSATGHLRSGEPPSDGVRELNEELGVAVTPDRLVPIGTRLLADDGAEGRNRERVHLFFLADDRPLDHFAPAVDEVDAVVEVEVDRLLAVLGGHPGPVGGVEWAPGHDDDHDLGPWPTEIRLDDLVDPVDGYWTVVLLMAQRFATGHGPLAI